MDDNEAIFKKILDNEEFRQVPTDLYADTRTSRRDDVEDRAVRQP